jgi:hypothetical protein
MTSITPISLNTLNRDAHDWLSIIRYHESGTVIQFQADCEYYIPPKISDQVILAKYLGKTYKKYVLDYIRLDEKNLLCEINSRLVQLATRKGLKIPIIAGKSEINEILTNFEKNGLSIGFFISHITSLLDSKNFQQFYDLEHILRTHHNLSIIFFSEIDITVDSYLSLVDRCSSMFTHIIKYPFYNSADTEQFITYNEKIWNVKIPTNIKKEIMFECGGHLWLIRQALRYWRDHRDVPLPELFTHDLMQIKLNVIWNKFTPDEQNILKNTATKTLTEKDHQSHEYRYLKSIGLIGEEFGRSMLLLPILNQIILNLSYVDEFRLANGKILLKGIEVSQEFSPEEKILITTLLEHKSEIISKEILAKKIWSDKWEDKYTDWALDRLTYRVRKKIQQLGINPKIIKSIKKKGVILS